MEYLIDNRPKILIIGAGPAGLTTALFLLRHNLARPIVLEAKAIPGGLSRTESHHGNLIDLGGHRFFTRSPEVRQLWENLLPSDMDPIGNDRVMLTRHRISRIFFKGHFFDYPLALSYKTLDDLGWSLSIQVAWSFLTAVFKPLKVHTLEDFYINRFGKVLYQLFFEDYTAKLWGRHPREIAPDWGAQRVKGLSLSRAIVTALNKVFGIHRSVETSLIESFSYPKKGPGQYWQVMAEEVIRLGGQIEYQAVVSAIHPEVINGDINYTLTACGPDGENKDFQGKALFSSMALKDLIAAWHPSPPERILHLAKNLPYRDFITCGVLVRKLKISSQKRSDPDRASIPDNWIYIQDRSVKMGRLQIFNNWSPALVADPSTTVWLGLEYFASEGDTLWSLSDSDFKAMAVRELVLLGFIDADQVLDQVVYRIQKAYPAYFDSYQNFPELKKYLQSIDNLYCIGRNGQHRYNNMDHSMLTALEAVRCFQGLSTQEALWSVNADSTYGG